MAELIKKKSEPHAYNNYKHGKFFGFVPGKDVVDEKGNLKPMKIVSIEKFVFGSPRRLLIGYNGEGKAGKELEGTGKTLLEQKNFSYQTEGVGIDFFALATLNGLGGLELNCGRFVEHPLDNPAFHVGWYTQAQCGQQRRGDVRQPGSHFDSAWDVWPVGDKHAFDAMSPLQPMQRRPPNRGGPADLAHNRQTRVRDQQ